MEEVKVINIDTSQAQENLDKVSKKVLALNKDLSKANENLKQSTEKLNNNFKSVGDTLTIVQKNSKEVSTSMSALSSLMSSFGINLNGLTGMLGTLNSGLKNAPNAFAGLTQGITGATKAGLKFIATPIGAVIAAVVVVLKAAQAVWDKLTEAINKNDDAGTAVARLYEVTIQPVVNTVTKAFDFLATAIGKVANYLADLLGGNKDLEDSNKSLVLSIDALEEAERQYATTVAENNKTISELRAKAADKEQYTAKERQQFLREAIDLEGKNLEEEKKIKAERLRILEETAKRDADTSDETKNKIAQARADLINAETNYNNTMRRLNKELNSAIKEDNAEREALNKEEAERKKQQQEQEEKAEQELIKHQNELLNIQLERNKRVRQSEEERLLFEKNIEEQRLLLLEEGTLEYEQQLTKIQEIENKLNDLNNKQEEDKQKQREDFLKQFQNEEDTEELSEADKIKLEEAEKLAALEEAWQKGLITEEEYQALKIQIQEETYEKEQALIKKEQKMLKDAAKQTLDNTLASLTSITKLFADESEEAFEAQKAFEISSAIIGGLRGAIGAYQGAASNEGLNAIPVIGPALAQAMGISAAAAVAASTAVQVKEISKRKFNDKSTNVKSVSSGGASTVNASAQQQTIMEPAQYQQATQTEELKDSLGNQKVYVTESDISNTINKVEVQESENRY